MNFGLFLRARARKGLQDEGSETVKDVSEISQMWRHDISRPSSPNMVNLCSNGSVHWEYDVTVAKIRCFGGLNRLHDQQQQFPGKFLIQNVKIHQDYNLIDQANQGSATSLR